MPTATSSAPKTVQQIFAGRDAAELVRYAERKGRELFRIDLSAAQVRNVLDSIQAMKSYDAGRFELLKPKLAYAAGKKPEFRDFRNVLEEAMRCVCDEESFSFFRSFVEAIVAYHALADAEERARRRSERQQRKENR